MLTRVSSDDRPHLLRMLPKVAFCDCGEPAVVKYFALVLYDDGTNRYRFEWNRCGWCPGTRKTQNVAVRAMPMEDRYRTVLQLLGDEQAFVSACRLGYRPPCYDEAGLVIDGLVDIHVEDWDDEAQ